MKLDKHHLLGCASCHRGNDKSSDKDIAHRSLISQPAHPDHMKESCGECHLKQVDDITHSLHMTLDNSVNMVRRMLGAKTDLDSLVDIPVPQEISTVVDLGDDLLRRRCLRCHLYSKGDSYAKTEHATGCGSCHLSFGKKKQDHSFLKLPSDDICLRCHYGNRVGFDYHGRFEQDLGNEYQTPHNENGDQAPPFGIQYHQLATDVHFQKGLICIDCHPGSSLMTAKSYHNTVTCRSCHDKELINLEQRKEIYKEEDNYFFRSQNSTTPHPLPLMTDPAHLQYEDKVACQACHAQWSFIDQPVHLFRSDVDEYDTFHHITNQGSSEVSNILLTSLDFDKDDPEPSMSDKITGEKRLGLWYKGFGTRRWESVILGRDQQNRVQVMRPMLDLHLTWVDEDEHIRFDSVSGTSGKAGLVPYIPHTTGKAGLFYEERLQSFFRSENKNSASVQPSEPDDGR